MIVSPSTQFLTAPARLPGERGHFDSTTLTPVKWQSVVVELIKLYDYVVVLALDQSSASAQVRKAIEDRYSDLDRLTGEALLVLTTARPPNGWSSSDNRVLRRLAGPAREYHTRELQLMENEHTAAVFANERAFLAEFFEPQMALPSLIFLWSAAATPADDAEVNGLAFDVSAFDTADRVVDLLSAIGTQAAAHARDKSSPKAFAETLFSPWNPLSLRWRNAILKTGTLAELLKKWVAIVSPS